MPTEGRHTPAYAARNRREGHDVSAGSSKSKSGPLVFAHADGNTETAKLPAAPPTALRAAGDPEVRRARCSGPDKIEGTTKVNPQGVGGFAALTFVVSDLVRTPMGGR
jgi:hypothetical protein